MKTSFNPPPEMGGTGEAKVLPRVLEEQIVAGDLYADGKIDGKDVSKLLPYWLGKIGSLE